MNARSVSKSAGLRLGMILTSILMTVMCLRPARGSEVVITVKGTVNGGRDMLGIFGMPRNIMPAGTPYTIVFTFDDTKGTVMYLGRCPNSGSGINGAGPASPGTAVLTINGKSFEFGGRPGSRARAWRNIATFCSDSELGISVQEGKAPLMTGVNIKIMPNPGQRSLSQERDWKSAVSLSNFDARNGDNAFVVRRDYNAETMSYLSVSSVTVSGPRAASPKAAAVVPEAKAAVTPAPVISAPLIPRPIGPEISRIYVLSADHGCKVMTYSVDGKNIGPTMWLGGFWCTGITVDPAGKIYVSTLARIGELVCFQPDGKAAAPSMNGVGATAIALDGTGKIYLLLQAGDDTGVVKGFTPEGQGTVPAIKTGLNNADGIQVDGSGKIYVVSQGYNVLKTYTATGEPTTPTIKAGVDIPRAVAVAPDGRIYIANFITVTAYSPDGQRMHSTIVHRLASSGGLDRPMGLAVDSRGRLYIGYASGMVGIFGPDGKPFSEGFMAAKDIRGIAVH
jgi:sugar lactone lactonase YvrE